MVRKIQFTFYLFSISLLSYTQTEERIIPPTIDTPESVFPNHFSETQITNPTLLNGPLKKVTKTVIQHQSHSNKQEYTDTYLFELDKNKKVVKYLSSDKFEDTYLSDFNLKDFTKKETVKKDTLIRRNGVQYNYKKGLLVLIEETNFDHAFMDSITFTYKKDKLVDIKEFKSLGAVEMDANGNIDESVIYFHTLELKSYEHIELNKDNLTTGKVLYYVNEDSINTYVLNYNYTNSNQLNSYKTTYKRYYIDAIDFETPVEEWTFNSELLVPNEHNTTTVNLKRDNLNRIVYYSSINNKQLAENEQKTVEKHSYYFNYTKSNSKTPIKVSGDYKKQLNSTGLTYKEFISEYTYDAYNNPILVQYFIIINGTKYLDQSTTLTIYYY